MLNFSVSVSRQYTSALCAPLKDGLSAINIGKAVAINFHLTKAKDRQMTVL